MFRTVQRSLLGQNDLNDVRVRFNKQARHLHPDNVQPGLDELVKRVDYVEENDEQFRSVIKFCQDSAIKDSQKLRYGLPHDQEDEADQAAAQTNANSSKSNLWLSEFVRKSRTEVDEITSKIENIKERISKKEVK